MPQTDEPPLADEKRFLIISDAFEYAVKHGYRYKFTAFRLAAGQGKLEAERYGLKSIPHHTKSKVLASFEVIE